MNRKNWKNKNHSRERWMAKLGEEFGEVAREVVELSDPSLGPANKKVNKANANLIVELEHVEFIARCWREQLERESISWTAYRRMNDVAY